MKRTILLLGAVALLATAAYAVVLAQGNTAAGVDLPPEPAAEPASASSAEPAAAPARMPPPYRFGPPPGAGETAPSDRRTGPAGPAGEASCTVLLVDDDWDYDNLFGPSDGGRPYYTSTLEVLGIGYDVWETESMGQPGLGDMAGYHTVIWFTGYAFQEGVFTPLNEQRAGQYLDAGGNLFLSSQDYYFEADDITAFMEEYLGIYDIYDDELITRTVGVAGDPIGDGLGPYTLVRPDDWHAYWPPGIFEGPLDDEVYALPDAAEPFRYDDPADTNPNSTRYDGGAFRTVYLGWPFEWIDTLEERAQAMDAVLSWLGCTAPLELRPAIQSESGPRGTSVPYTLTLKNNTDSPESYSITYGGDWPASGPGAVGPIAGGSSEEFVAWVAVPMGAGCYEVGRSTVTAIASGGQQTGTAWLETTALPEAVGGLAGTVYDANTGLGVDGAKVSLELGAVRYETETLGDGSYSLAALPNCTFLGEFQAMGYDGQAGIVVPIAGGVTATLDVTLDAPWPVLSPGQVSVEVPAHSIELFLVTLDNIGSSDLTFSVAGKPRGAGAALPRPGGQAGDVAIPWLTVDPVSGVVAPDESQEIELTFDAGDLPWGQCYAGDLGMQFNDPYSGTTTVPVEMCVVECSPVAPAAPVLAPIENPDGRDGYLVDWDDPACTLGYTLEEDDNAGFDSPLVVYTGSGSEHPVADQPLGTWFYRVRAENSWGTSPWSNWESTRVGRRVYLPLVQRDGP